MRVEASLPVMLCPLFYRSHEVDHFQIIRTICVREWTNMDAPITGGGQGIWTPSLFSKGVT